MLIQISIRLIKQKKTSTKNQFQKQKLSKDHYHGLIMLSSSSIVTIQRSQRFRGAETAASPPSRVRRRARHSLVALPSGAGPVGQPKLTSSHGGVHQLGVPPNHIIHFNIGFSRINICKPTISGFPNRFVNQNSWGINTIYVTGTPMAMEFTLRKLISPKTIQSPPKNGSKDTLDAVN